MDITYRITDTTIADGLILRAEGVGRDLSFAIYSQDGVRLAGKASDEFFAAADVAAPAKAAEMFAARTAKLAADRRAKEMTQGAIKARFGGTCGVTSRSYSKGTLIRNTNYGWAIADERTMTTLETGTMGKGDPGWLGRQMDREDSQF